MTQGTKGYDVFGGASQVGLPVDGAIQFPGHLAHHNQHEATADQRDP